MLNGLKASTRRRIVLREPWVGKTVYFPALTWHHLHVVGV
jgi:hypothetical protein